MVDHTIITALGETTSLAIDVALKATGLLLAARVVGRLLSRHCSICCSTFWHACLVGLLVLPLAAAILPHWQVSFLRGPAAVAPAAAGLPAAAWPKREASDRRPLSLAMALWYERALGLPRAAITQTTPSPTAAVLAGWPAWVLGAYLAGTAVLAARLLAALLAIPRVRRSCAPIDHPAWLASLERWRRHLGIDRPVALALSDRVNVPVVLGWRRPTILIPRAVFARNGAHRDPVLLHELCHVRRHDYVWHLVLRVAQTLYWFLPPMWAASRAIGRARERTCDDVCVHHLNDRVAYRSALVAFASNLLRAAPAPPGPAMARSTRIGHRLDWIERTRGSARCVAAGPARAIVGLAIVGAALAIGMTQLAHARAYLERAGQLLEQGRLEAAIADLDQALELVPRRAEALEALNDRGRAYLSLGRPEVALRDLDRVVQLDPRHARAHNNRGNALDRLGLVDQARAAYHAAIARDPADPMPHDNLARLHHALGQSDQALAEVDRALAIQPAHAPALNSRGILHLEGDRVDLALADFDQAIDLAPDYAEAHYNRAACLARLGDLGAALAGIDTALGLDPRLVDAYVGRGRIWRQLDDLDSALADFDRALALSPEHAQALLERAHTLFDRGEHRSAAEAYGLLLATHPVVVDAWLYRGFCHIHLEQPDLALADLDEAARLRPDRADIMAYRASVLAHQGQGPQALGLLDRALELQPDLHVALFYRARLHRQRGELALAGRDLDAAIRLDDNAPHYRRERAELRRQAGDLVAAQTDLDVALRHQGPTRPAARMP